METFWLVNFILWVNYAFKTLTTNLFVTVGHKTKEELSLSILFLKKHWYVHVKQTMEPFNISIVPYHKTSYEKNNYTTQMIHYFGIN